VSDAPASIPSKGRPTHRDAGIAVAILGIAVGAFVAIAIDQCWLGLGSCEDRPDVRIEAASSLFNAGGSDDPGDEYVCLVSAEDDAVELAGWELREADGSVVNTLPAYSLAPGASVRVHPGEGRDSGHDLFGESGSPVWTNSGDSVTLVDSNGETIASESYGEQDEGRPDRACD